MKVLIVCVVESSDRCDTLLQENMKILAASGDDVSFEWAISHFDLGADRDGEPGLWRYPQDVKIALNRCLKGCKVTQWLNIEPDLARSYEYI